MTKIVISLVCAVAALHCVYAASTRDNCLSATKINNKFFEKEVLASDIAGEPNDISVQDATGDIFFTRINSDGEDDDRMKIFVLRHGSTKPEEVKGIKGLGQSTTVDNDHNVVYFAADSGIYNYDPETKEAKLFTEDGVDVIHLFYANGALYSAVWPDYDVFKITKNGTHKDALETDFVYGNYLVVDEKGNYYFVGKTNYLYVAPVGFSEKIRFLGIAKEPSTIFAVDRKDNVFVTGDEKIYRVRPDAPLPQYVGSVDFPITALVFDGNNNVIIGKKGQLLRYNRIDC